MNHFQTSNNNNEKKSPRNSSVENAPKEKKCISAYIIIPQCEINILCKQLISSDDGAMIISRKVNLFF